jgi:peptidoglycan/xylan/chitin deacetylase (PgdA/CDA1 family)
VTARRLPVLTFHAIDSAAAPFALTPGMFQYGIRQLHEHGYTTIDVLDVAARLRTGQPFGATTVAITFDDGYESVYTEAFPVLRAHGMTATVFVTTGDRASAARNGRLPRLEGREMLDWSQIREMARAGMTIGAHSMSHPDLRRLSDRDVSVEILGSKKVLEDRLGCEVSSFAYPFGLVDRRSHAVVQEHFAAGCSDRLGYVDRSSDPWALERLDTYYLRSERRFDAFFRPWFPSYVRARNVPRRLRRLVEGR